MSVTRSALAQVPLFQDLDEKALGRLERLTRERAFGTGEVIVKEGDEGTGFFLITSGKVVVTREGTELSVLGVDEFFGEMALLDNYRRSATVTAKEPTTCLAMLRSDFIAELRSNGDLAVEILALMSRRVREADRRLAQD